MSDLIDFDSPNTNNGQLLASPLIPVPKSSRSDGSNSSEAGSHFSETRRSMEIHSNDPFDIVMKKITDYERNKEDPFERVIEKAMGFSDGMSIESKDDFVVPRRRRFSDILKMNKTLDETESNLDLSMKEKKDELVQEENDMSIIRDLNNTNLIGDNIDGRQVVASWSCDNKMVPIINVSPASDNMDLSILSNSAMDDSLLDHGNDLTEEVKSSNTGFNSRPRSMSQNNFLSSKNVSPRPNNRRSLSVTDTVKYSTFGVDNMLSSAQSSIFDDPLNNAFRKPSLRSNTSSSSSYLNYQFNLSTNKHKFERLNSDSSVFSGLSNISSIPMDSYNKLKHDRFCSESSIISDLSIIPVNGTISSSDTSAFTSDTINRGFIASRSQLNSTSTGTEKTPLKSDKSDLIKKFYAIKTRMSINQTEQPKSENKNEFDEKQSSLSTTKPNVSQKEECSQDSDEKLIDVDNSSNSVFNDQTDVNIIISHEARALAETFEKMAISKESNSTAEDDILFSKTQLNFDDLPPSDDEAVDNLIDLPPSPLKDTPSEEAIGPKETPTEPSILSPENNIKALESEFIEQNNSNKKAMAATLLLDLEKLIKEENNPNACKVLNDLQKLLGVECDNNTEILQVCLQNTNHSFQSEKKIEENANSLKNVFDKNHELNENVQSECKNDSSNSKEVSENKERHSNDNKHESNVNVENESQNTTKPLENKKNSGEQSEDHKLATNLLRTLNKIVNEENEDSAVDILRNLGTILNMATELRTKNKVKQNSELKVEKNVSKQLNRSTTSLHRSPSPRNISVKLQNKSFEMLPLRRSATITPTSNSNLLDVPKDKRKSHLLNIKRFPSDPGFMNPASDKPKSPKGGGYQTTLTRSKSTVEPVKSKFKKKTNSEVVTKKGPLKAVIPLGNMQKRGSISHRVSNYSGNVTPPKPADSIPTVKIVSSTPNTYGGCQNSKSKPTASSTPNIEGLRTQRANIQSKQNSKSTLTCSISPVSLNSSLNGNVGVSKNSSTRTERTLSPQKKSKKNSESGTETKLPRYSPRPVRVRTHSLNALKTVKSPQSTTTKLAPKISSEKKIQSKSVLSPLKNSNKLLNKGNPMNLVSRLGKPSRIQTGPEKENYA